MYLRSLAISICAVAAIFIVAGCGGAESSGPPLTKAQFIKQGDAICVEADEERVAGLKRYIENPEKQKQLSKSQEEAVVLEVVLPPFQTEAEELSELTPPVGDEDTTTAIITAIEEAVERGEADPASILKGAVTQFGEAEKMAHKYGFKHCGRS